MRQPSHSTVGNFVEDDGRFLLDSNSVDWSLWRRLWLSGDLRDPLLLLSLRWSEWEWWWRWLLWEWRFSMTRNSKRRLILIIAKMREQNNSMLWFCVFHARTKTAERQQADPLMGKPLNAQRNRSQLFVSTYFFYIFFTVEIFLIFGLSKFRVI